jgi:hypothetical protein
MRGVKRGYISHATSTATTRMKTNVSLPDINHIGGLVMAAGVAAVDEAVLQAPLAQSSSRGAASAQLQARAGIDHAGK